MLHDEADERASSAVHILAFLLAVVLLAYSVEVYPRDAAARTNLAVFAASMALMYLASALFHAVPQGRLKQALERMDRAAIFVFIAATYSLFQFRDAPVVSISIWMLATAGASASIIWPAQRPARIAIPYVVLGWLAVSGVVWQSQFLSNTSLCLLIIGAVVYTGGLRYYLAARACRFSHTGWHLSVATGSAIHTAAALV